MIDDLSTWVAAAARDSVPPDAAKSVIEWAQKNVRLPGSARSEKYDASITPWTNEPLEMACSGEAKVITFIKPVQGGGSVAGEVAICYWLATESGGDVQYNWNDDGKAKDRWDKRFERILRACPAVMVRAPKDDKIAGKMKKCLWLFPHCNLTVQGVFQPNNLTSDSIRFQVNEELHSWESGRLAQAYGRTTAVWNYVIFNISNGGNNNDQLHVAMMEGTNQQWEVPCSGCGKFHVMRTKWDENHPELGGLRYNSDKCKYDDGSYNYKRLERTIRYQFPCGHQISDDRFERRKMSLGGRYGKPRNRGAKLENRSYSLEAVSVDYIPWIKLIQEKHTALKALRLGDPEPYMRYIKDRECGFWDDDDRPVLGTIVLNEELKKAREGLPDRIARLAALDRQMGNKNKGELPHWWVVIRDVRANGDSRLVWEGKCLTDEDAADTTVRHDVPPVAVVCDSGDDTTHVYNFCLKHGFNAIKGSGEASFASDGGVRRIFSSAKPLYLMANLPTPTRDNPHEEPMFWFYSKQGIRERLHYIRASNLLKWEVPGDVSDDYKAHMESEELQERKMPRSNEIIREFVQVKRRNDLYVCECYIAMLMDILGLVGAQAVENTKRKKR